MRTISLVFMAFFSFVSFAGENDLGSFERGYQTGLQACKQAYVCTLPAVNYFDEISLGGSSKGEILSKFDKQHLSMVYRIGKRVSCQEI